MFIALEAAPENSTNQMTSKDDECRCFQCEVSLKKSAIRSHVGGHILRARRNVHEELKSHVSQIQAAACSTVPLRP